MCAANQESSVLFVSHDASRTGAPILLLRFLTWLKEHSAIPFIIVIGRGGPLQVDFARLAPTFVLPGVDSGGWPHRVLSKTRIGAKSILRLRLEWLRSRLKRYRIGLIYANTVASAGVLGRLNLKDAPVISHVHELEASIAVHGGVGLPFLLERTRHFIACADAVKTNLVANHMIAEEMISVIHGFSPTPAYSPAAVNHLRSSIRRQIGAVDDAVLVVAAGTLDWRKGADLFVQLARIVETKSRCRDIQFVWIGGEVAGRRFSELRHDIAHCNLDGLVHLVGEQLNPLDWFAASDLFVLTSREDPFPLVCLEAASVGRPIICFDRAGGEPEFVEDDAGFVVDYLNLDIMADKVAILLADTGLRTRLGARARRKVYERHTVNVIGPKMLYVIERFLGKC